jgi:hypothetical protein
MSANSGFLLYNPPQSVGVNPFTEGLTLDYDPVARSVAVPNGSSSQTFVASEIVAASTSSVIRYAKANGNYLELTTPVAAGSAADYVRFVDVTSTQATLGDRVLALTGIPTRTADLPKSGRVQYTRSNIGGEALVRGTVPGNNKNPAIYSLSNSTLTLTVDFSARTIQFTISLVGTPKQGGPDVALSTISGSTGFEDRSVVSVVAPNYPSIDKAVIAGVLFGPAAAEAGFVLNFAAWNPSTARYLDVVALGFADR